MGLTKYYRKDDTNRKWYVVDASGQVVGRLASKIARILMGKEKAIYTPNADTGDFVIAVNVERMRYTGNNKGLQKKYYRHSGYIGNLKETTLKDMMEKHPERVLYFAVKGMLPKNKLGRQMIKKLKIYSGDAHPHSAQKPETLEI